MYKKITVSSPGKLMLFGEHAVVHNHPCIVTAVDQRMMATVELAENGIFELNAKDVQVVDYKKSIKDLRVGDIPKGAKFVEIAVKNFLEKYPLINGIKITTKSGFSNKFGFGSSSASTVCIVKALLELTGKKLDNKEIFDLSYKTVLEIQGKASGFDIAASIYGGTIFFHTAGKIIEPLIVKDLPLVVGYTGIKADTVTLVNMVLEKKKKNPLLIENIFNKIEDIVGQAKKALVQSDWKTLGKLMDSNEILLEKLGVGTGKLCNMIKSAIRAGAYGAKLSGAGGGDCMIALVSKENRQNVEKAIEKAGGEVIKINTNAEGAKVEK